jgi:hypothetical protein
LALHEEGEQGLELVARQTDVAAEFPFAGLAPHRDLVRYPPNQLLAAQSHNRFDFIEQPVPFCPTATPVLRALSGQVLEPLLGDFYLRTIAYGDILHEPPLPLASPRAVC